MGTFQIEYYSQVMKDFAVIFSLTRKRRKKEGNLQILILTTEGLAI